MMQGPGSESMHPSSPRTGRNDSMTKLSLLGPQFFGSGGQQQQHHLHQSHQHPANSNSAGMNFSLGVQSHGQSFGQGHQQLSSQPANNSNNGGGSGGGGGGEDPGFSSLQNVSSMGGGAGQGFNQNHQFMNQQILQAGNGAVADFVKIQSAQGLGMTSGPGVSQESILNALSMIQQNISQLQAMVPYMGQSQQVSNATVQQQAAAAISQIARVAANLFPPNQQPQQMPTAQPPMSGGGAAHQQQQQQQLGQVFGGGSVPPAFNFMQHGGGSAPGRINSIGNSYPSRQGPGGGCGVNLDVGGGSAGSLASQIVDGGVSGNSANAPGPGLGGAPKSTPSSGGQAFGAGQGGAENGSSLGNNMNSGSMVGTKQHGDPRSDQMGSGQMGSGLTRGGSVSTIAAREIAHMSSSRGLSSAGMTASPMDDHEDLGGGTGPRDEDDDGDAENLLPGSYDLVEMDALEILAEHTHFCEICGKGFKRDANLRMHMRGHGDEYKTPAALARPDKASHDVSIIRPRRFSCPYVGCKRNKKHRKFQPLKTMLCVKNHYRRSHCPKILTCQKCKTKKFSVVADLKTHEKHCGCDKWQCSCGTTFSRKDKLFGHIGLFAGHTPAMPFNDVDGSEGLDVSDMGGGPGNPSPMPNQGNNNTSGYGLSSGGNINSGSASSMGLGGGSGMGLGGNGLQGLSSRGGSQGGNGMNMAKGGNVLGPENSSSSDSFPSTGMISGNYLPGSLFSANFLQSSSGGNSSPDGIH